MSSLIRYINELKNASVSKKVMIIKILSSSRQEKVKEVLIDCLNDFSPAVRLAALQALEKIDYYDENLLIKLCHDNSKLIRKIAIKMLSKKPKVEYLKKLNSLIIDSDKFVRLEVINFLYKLGKDGITLLQRALKDEDELVRNKALHYLQLLESDKVEEDKNNISAEQNIPEISSPRILGSITTEERIKEELSFEEKINEINEKLKSKKINSLEYLLSLIEDKSWTIREYAIQKISELEKIEVSRIYELLKHPLWYVRAAAVKILGLRKDKDIIDLLVPLIKDSNVEVRRAIAEALGRINKADAIMPLRHLLNDRSIMVRKEAEKALAAYRKEKDTSF